MVWRSRGKGIPATGHVKCGHCQADGTFKKGSGVLRGGPGRQIDLTLLNWSNLTELRDDKAKSDTTDRRREPLQAI